MATWGYLRISTNDQKTERLAILEYANKKGLTVDHWIEAKARGGTVLPWPVPWAIAMLVDELLQNKVS